MSDLNHYQKYSRKDVRDILEPSANFAPGAGTWGLQGIININGDFDHFVFFITYGREQSGHSFNEGINTKGVLSWQSQPRQHLQEKRVRHWIQQKSNNCKISLLVRNDKKAQYIYVGELTYINHDKTKENPVYFEFQINGWRYLQHLHAYINPLEQKNITSSTLKKRISNNKNFFKKDQSNSDLIRNKQLKSLLDSHPELLGTEEGKELQFDYETTLGSTIPLVVHTPGKEKYVVMYSEKTHDSELFMDAGRLIQHSVELAIELERQIQTDDIRKVLFLSKGNLPVTEKLADKYQILLIYLN